MKDVGRTGGRAVRAILLVAALLSAGPPDRLLAQDSTAGPPRDTLPRDTIAPRRMAPGAAFWRSLVIPGWGQAATGRHVTGAAFVAWEGVTMMMTLKAQEEANYLKSIGSGHLKTKRQEVQDWMVLWIFNHLFAGADAFVASLLWDLPARVGLQQLPRGVGVGLSVRW